MAFPPMAPPTYLSSVRLRSGLLGERETVRDRSLRRWRAILLKNPDASPLGTLLCSMTEEEHQLEAIEEALMGKSNGTVNKRALAVQRFRVFCQETLGLETCFPFEEKTMYVYYRHLQAEKFSALKEFSETVNFCVHVLRGGCTGELKDPRISGLMRDGRLHRRTPRQSRVLTVSEVLRSGHPFDLYAAGVFLFMLYSKSRCSDIKNADVTRVDQGTTGSRSGYIEAETLDEVGPSPDLDCTTLRDPCAELGPGFLRSGLFVWDSAEGRTHWTHAAWYRRLWTLREEAFDIAGDCHGVARSG